MPNAILMHLDDKLGSGQMTFENTGVVYGDDGITGLLYNLPVPQNEWTFSTTGVQTRADALDGTTKRIMTRATGAAAASQVATIAKRVLMARDFGSWPDQGFKVITRKHGAGGNAITMTLYGPGGVADAAVDHVSVLPVAADTFEQFVMSPSGLYTPNDFLTLQVAITTTLVGDYVEIGDIEMIVRSKRGNI